MTNRKSVLALVVLFLASLTRAATDNGPPFILETVSGDTFRGPVVQLLDGWTVRLGGRTRLRRGPDEWLGLVRADRPRPGFPSGPHLILTSGDRIPINPAGLSLARERLGFTHAGLNEGREVRVPISAVAVLWLANPRGEDAEILRQRLVNGERHRDTVMLRNGDVLEGVLSRLDAKQVKVEVGRKEVAIDLPRVAVLALSTDLATRPRPKGRHARVTLTDGTRLTLSSAVCEDGRKLTGKTAFGATLGVSLDQVAVLELVSDRVIFLSALEPKEYRHTPYLGVSWPLVRDGSVVGRDLRLGGGVFDRGLGMHSASRVTYRLPAGCRRFEALVGLDERTGRRGSVRVRVLVDGKEQDRGLKGDLTGAMQPVAIRVDVSGAKELTLLVDFGRGGNVGDHVDWGNARLVK
jgi:NPCBM/NEW2 domain